ncbi:hypothetical protein CRUP_003181 [Coryphaenoides rupestris]|nr:hypothetical protein CRUP_003181 [Coryphaenoides rupestris]
MLTMSWWGIIGPPPPPPPPAQTTSLLGLGPCREAKLLSHRRSECQKPKFRCKNCAVVFHDLDALLAHKSTHNPKRRGRPPKKYAPESEQWRNTDEMLIMPDHRGIISTPQTSWSQDTQVPMSESVVNNTEEEEDEDEEEICSPVNDGDLALPSMGALRVHKEDVHGPLPATGPWTPDKNIVVPKKEEEEELDHRAEDQRALEHMKTLLPEQKEEEVEEEGGASESQQPRYNMSCSVGDCDLTFSSMEELRVHKKGDHGPRRTPNKKTIVVPKEEEEEWRNTDEMLIMPDHCGTISTPQTSWSQDIKIVTLKEEEDEEEICSPVNDGDLTLPSMEELRVHKKGDHGPRRTPNKKTIVVPKEEEAGKGKGALTVQTSWRLDMKTLVPKEVEVGAEVAGTAEDQRVLRSQRSWPPDKKTMVPKEKEEVVASTAEDQSAQMTNPQQPMKDGQLPMKKRGRPAKKKPRYSIPCPMDDCDLTFSSVEELKAHKKDVHRPQPAPERAPPHLP